MPPEALALFPPFPPNLTGVWAPNQALAKHATRLFEGRVSGAESVAVAPDGMLVMLDKCVLVQPPRCMAPCTVRECSDVDVCSLFTLLAREIESTA